MSMLRDVETVRSNKTEEVSGQGRQEENQEQVHLTFLTNEAAGDEQHLEYYEQLISNFESKNPGITVELLQGRGLAGYGDKAECCNVVAIPILM